MSGYPETPELDRMLAVHEQAQQLGEFLEWLNEHGAVMCEWRESGSNGQPRQVTIPWPDDMHYYRKEDWEVLNERYGVYGWDHEYTKNGDHVLVYNNPDYEYWDEGFHPIHRTIQGWLALYFGLDEKKMDRERDAVLAYVREQNSKGGDDA